MGNACKAHNYVVQFLNADFTQRLAFLAVIACRRSRSRALGVHSTYDGCCPRLVSQSSLMEFAMSRVLWRTCEERPSRASVHEMHEWIMSNDTFPWTQLCLQQPRHAAHTNGRACRPCSKCRANGCGGCAPRSAQGAAHASRS